MAKKAVLIFDMPEDCTDCGCFNSEYICCQAKNNQTLIGKYGVIPDWCPLIKMNKSDIVRARMYLERLEYVRENRLCRMD